MIGYSLTPMHAALDPARIARKPNPIRALEKVDLAGPCRSIDLRTRCVRVAGGAASILLALALLGCDASNSEAPAAAAIPTAPTAALEFVAADGDARAVDLEALRAACEASEIEVDDPYHRKRMRYAALPLRCVLDRGFDDGGGAEGLRGQGLLLRALDGYTRPVAGRELLEQGGFLAFGEPERLARVSADESPFSPLDRRQVDPAPFYMVWTGADQNDPHTHPWPYQLARIEVAPFEAAFPHTVPTGLFEGDPGWAGYRLFKSACASCHAINGEGGKVGPDLNVPRSIVEYRPIEQIRSYIRNPEATRYTSMPAHADLAEADLDALIAYFRAMSERKSDPKSRGES